MSTEIHAVYVSSTRQDLATHRAAVLQQIASMNLRPVSMEAATAEERPPIDSCLDAVRSSDVYVGIFAHRYGFIPPSHAQSMTELEYRAAGEAAIDRLIFLVEEQHPWKFSDTDASTGEGDRGTRIQNLRDELRLLKTVQFFTTPEDLASKVGAALHTWTMSARQASPAPDDGMSAALRMYLKDCVAKEGELDRRFVFLSGTGERLVVPPTSYPIELMPRAFRVIRTLREPEREVEIMPSIAEVLERYPRVVIVGEPGSGKSTTLRYLHLVKAQQALENAGVVPLYINLAEWPESIPDLRSLLVHERDIKGCPSVPASNLLLLLDGLNEVRERDYDARVDSIQRWLDENPVARVVVAARQQQYVQNKQLRTAMVTIHPLTDIQVETFVEKYLGPMDARGLLSSLAWDRRDTADRRHLARLAENPFQLALLCYVYAESGKNLPSTRGELLRILTETTYQREAELGTHAGLTLEEMGAGLGELALSSIQARSGTAIDGAWASRRVPREIDFEKLRDLGVNTRLLRLSKNDRYIQFSHQLILEYFAAERLSKQLSRLPSVLRKPRFQHGQRRAQATDEVCHTLAEIHPDFAECLDAIAETDPFIAIDALAESDRGGEIGVERRAALAKKLLDAQKGRVDTARNAIFDRVQTLGDASVVALHGLLANGNKPERRLAIEALASISSFDAIEQLIVALDDSDRWVRREAREALLWTAERDPQLAMAFMTQRLLEDTPRNHRLRELLVPPTPVHNAHSIAAPSPVQTVAAGTEKDVTIGRMSIAGERGIYEKESRGLRVRDHPLDELIDKLGHSTKPSDEMRAELSRYGTAAIPILLEALQSTTNDSKRMRIAQLLGDLGDSRAIEALRELVDDRDGAVATQAIRGLTLKFADASMLPLLERLLNTSMHGPVRMFALRALMTLKGSDAEQIVLRHIEDANNDVRCAAMHLLSERHVIVPVEVLQRAIATSNHRGIRHVALEWLFAIDPPQGLEDAIGLLNVSERPDRFVLRRVVRVLLTLTGEADATTSVIGTGQELRVKIHTYQADLERILRAMASRHLGLLGAECRTALDLLAKVATGADLPPIP
jgi:HEAT repeat protein